MVSGLYIMYMVYIPEYIGTLHTTVTILADHRWPPLEFPEHHRSPGKTAVVSPTR
jgi:hypothetical protein